MRRQGGGQYHSSRTVPVWDRRGKPVFEKRRTRTLLLGAGYSSLENCSAGNEEAEFLRFSMDSWRNSFLIFHNLRRA